MMNNRPILPIGINRQPLPVNRGLGLPAGGVVVANSKIVVSGNRDVIISRTTTAADSAPVSGTVNFPATANLLDIEFAVAGTVGFLAIVLPDNTQVAKICVPNQASPSTISGDIMSLFIGVNQANYVTQLFGAGSIIADFHFGKLGQ